jgi:hypothetical protein
MPDLTDATMPLWIIAICALIWTARMLLTGVLLWLARRYQHWPTPPLPVRVLGAIIDGGRW